MENIYIKATRFSLFLKVVISALALYIAIMSDKLNIGRFYLVAAIVFAGLFLFQLKYYQKKKAERGNDRN
jgi:predicted membrane protein